MLIHKVHALTYSFPHNSIHYTKISSHGLITEHKQFNLNHSIKHIFAQKYFVNTIHITIHVTIHITIYVNSKTIGLLFTTNHPTSVPLCELEIHGHFRSHTHQHTIYFINYETNTSNSPYKVTDCPNGLQKFQQFGFKFWDRSNGPSRPQTNTIINKTLKQSVTQVG